MIEVKVMLSYDDNPQCNNGYCHNLTSVYRCHIDQTNIMNQVILAIIIIINNKNNNNNNNNNIIYQSSIFTTSITRLFPDVQLFWESEKLFHNDWTFLLPVRYMPHTYYTSLNIKDWALQKIFSWIWPVGHKKVWDKYIKHHQPCHHHFPHHNYNADRKMSSKGVCYQVIPPYDCDRVCDGLQLGGGGNHWGDIMIMPFFDLVMILLDIYTFFKEYIDCSGETSSLWSDSEKKVRSEREASLLAKHHKSR